MIDSLAPSINGKIKYLYNDLVDHFKYFIKNGYIRYLPLVLLVKFLTYFAYLKCYSTNA